MSSGILTPASSSRACVGVNMLTADATSATSLPSLKVPSPPLRLMRNVARLTVLALIGSSKVTMMALGTLLIVDPGTGVTPTTRGGVMSAASRLTAGASTGSALRRVAMTVAPTKVAVAAVASSSFLAVNIRALIRPPCPTSGTSRSSLPCPSISVRRPRCRICHPIARSPAVAWPGWRRRCPDRSPRRPPNRPSSS